MDRHASALDVAAAIRAKEVSPVEVLDHYLAEVDRLDPVLNAFSLRDDERARADARAAAERLAGADADDLPPFLGVPMPIKDLVSVAGQPNTRGSLGVSDAPQGTSDPIVDRLVNGGFLPMGRTNTAEVGMTQVTENKRYGVTRNPWNLARTPGGSSGGSAASVAAGIVPVAHGGDGGGSIRIPASA